MCDKGINSFGRTNTTISGYVIILFNINNMDGERARRKEKKNIYFLSWNWRNVSCLVLVDSKHLFTRKLGNIYGFKFFTCTNSIGCAKHLEKTMRFPKLITMALCLLAEARSDRRSCAAPSAQASRYT
jgi:hypothetical protein